MTCELPETSLGALSPTDSEENLSGNPGQGASMELFT